MNNSSFKTSLSHTFDRKKPREFVDRKYDRNEYRNNNNNNNQKGNYERSNYNQDRRRVIYFKLDYFFKL